MMEKILIVEDEFIVANDLRLMLKKTGYQVVGIASSVEQARILLETKLPDWVLLDIKLKGELTGVDFAWELSAKQLPFLYISANTDQRTLELAKATQPYGFMVKPFREKDLLVMLDIARYRHGAEQKLTSATTKVALQKEMGFDGIIGKSNVLADVLRKVSAVAEMETSVLILGESGTGKEKIAESIHRFSNRKSKPYVIVNCAALPINLIESDLFGHERGAFTGANNKRIGKFEQADGGTIFLDEIGELPLESQVKLLRVLQEKEIDPLGSSKTVKINVRVIAATNRILEKEVAEGRFRLDLYYRLNVFPLQMPPLRDRKDDIEELANFFLKKYALQSKKAINLINPDVLKQLIGYDWPGNIRELEHLIERSVLLATGNEIETVELPKVEKKYNDKPETRVIKTMLELERDHIMHVLTNCKGRVFGPGGAAELLNIPPTTLYSKMKKFGIKQGYY